MEKSVKLLYGFSECLVLILVTIGYWIEMAEELEVDGTIAKAGKGALVLLKLLVLSR